MPRKHFSPKLSFPKHNSFISAVCLLLVCISIPLQTLGQFSVRENYLPTSSTFGPDTLAGMWREAGNPAGMAEAGIYRTGQLQAAGFSSSGDLRSVREPERISGGFFHAKGTQNIGNWMLLGDVLLSQTNHGSVFYRNHAPVRTNNPYQWVDTTGGDWDNMHILLKSSAASPIIFQKFRVGYSVAYEVMQGARQNAERPLFTYNRYFIRKGLKFSISDNIDFGVSGSFQGKKEEQELGFFNQLDTYVLILRGIGTFNQTTFNSASRSYSENTFGGGIQVHIRRSDMGLVSFLDISSSTENVSTGISNPVSSGEWNTFTFSSGVTLYQTPKNISREFGLRSYWTSGEGIDPFLNGKNILLNHFRGQAFFKNTWLSNSKTDRLSFMFRATFDVHDLEDIVSASDRLLSLLSVDASMARRTQSSQYGIRANYYIPLKNRLNVRSMNEAVRRIFLPDFLLLEQNIATISSTVGRYFVIGTSDIGVTVDAFISIHPEDGFSPNRLQRGMSISLTLAL